MRPIWVDRIAPFSENLVHVAKEPVDVIPVGQRIDPTIWKGHRVANFLRRIVLRGAARMTCHGIIMSMRQEVVGLCPSAASGSRESRVSRHSRVGPLGPLATQ
jgi:hypothetical protein